MTGPANVLLLSPYADALLPTFKRAGDTVETHRTAKGLVDASYNPARMAELAEWIVLYAWPLRILPEEIREFDGRILNLHISLLPWNRGADPNFWSWRDDTPKGGTIHQVDEGLDTGPILVQHELTMHDYYHTLASSHKRLSATVEGLFATHWDAIRDGEIDPREQDGPGSYHKKADLDPFRWALEDWSLPCGEVAGLGAKP